MIIPGVQCCVLVVPVGFCIDPLHGGLELNRTRWPIVLINQRRGRVRSVGKVGNIIGNMGCTGPAACALFVPQVLAGGVRAGVNVFPVLGRDDGAGQLRLQTRSHEKLSGDRAGFLLVYKTLGYPTDSVVMGAGIGFFNDFRLSRPPGCARKPLVLVRRLGQLAYINDVARFVVEKARVFHVVVLDFLGMLCHLTSTGGV